MFVDAQVSSLKMSCSGSRSSWPSNHFLAPLQDVGRAFSVAFAVFFACDPAPREEPPYRAKRDLGAVIGQKRLQFGQCNGGRRFVSLKDQLGMRFDLHRTPIAALPLWHRRPLLVCKLLPRDGAGRADTELYRGLPARQTTRDRRYTSIPKIY